MNTLLRTVQAHWMFFGSEDSLHDVRQALAQAPELAAHLLHQANEAAHHQFCFLADQAITHDTDGELQWHKDYRSGYTWAG